MLSFMRIHFETLVDSTAQTPERQNQQPKIRHRCTSSSHHLCARGRREPGTLRLASCCHASTAYNTLAIWATLRCASATHRSRHARPSNAVVAVVFPPSPSKLRDETPPRPVWRIKRRGPAFESSAEPVWASGGGGASSATVTVVEHNGDSKASGSGRMNRLRAAASVNEGGPRTQRRTLTYRRWQTCMRAELD